MSQIDLILLNFQEIRRKSIKLWTALPEESFHWKPDANAMSAIEMIRHVLEADYGWNIIINRGDMSHFQAPSQGRKYISVQDELEFSASFRSAFIESVSKFSDEDLTKIEVTHPGNGKKKPLGQYLLRIGYHESVHTGHFLSYLRAMGVERPQIWD